MPGLGARRTADAVSSAEAAVTTERLACRHVDSESLVAFHSRRRATRFAPVRAGTNSAVGHHCEHCLGQPYEWIPREPRNIAKSRSRDGEPDLSKVRLPARCGPRGPARQRGLLLPTVRRLATLRVRVLARPRSRQGSRRGGRDRPRAGLYGAAHSITSGAASGIDAPTAVRAAI